MRPDEMLIPVGEARELTPAEMAETQHEDPEVTLITEYLLGELTGDAREAVARRLEEDSAFRGRVGMIVAAWEHWPGPQDFALPAHEVHASWERVERKAMAAGLLPDAASPDRHGAARERGEGMGREKLRRKLMLAAAATLLLAVGVPTGVWLWVTIGPRLTAPVVMVTEGGDNSSATARLDGASRAFVFPESRLTWSDRMNTKGVRELHLVGTAMFRLAPLKEGMYVVETPSARITVTGTAFTVWMPNPSTTRVEVQEGSVVLESLGMRGGAPVTLMVGEQGEAVWGTTARRGR